MGENTKESGDNKGRKHYADYNREYDNGEYLSEDAEYIDPEFLKEYSQADKENIKLVSNEYPINPLLMMIDISLNPKGVDEEKVYMQHPEYIKNIRRGNTLVEFYHLLKGEYILDHVEMARKGLMKFVDLYIDYLKPNSQLDYAKKLSKTTIMGPIKRAFGQGNSVQIIN